MLFSPFDLSKSSLGLEPYACLIFIQDETIVIPDSQDEPEEEQITEEEIIPSSRRDKPEIIDLLDSD